MSESDFSIKILEQGWISPENAESDLCSHGRIRLEIGGQVIESGEEEEWGIGVSALSMLRTLRESGYTSELDMSGNPTERVIHHGCSHQPETCCLVGINWSVVRSGKTVILKDVTKHLEQSDTPTERYSDLTVEMLFDDYRQEVLSFALGAKELFVQQPKQLHDEIDQFLYREFWEEFDRILSEQRDSGS